MSTRSLTASLLVATLLSACAPDLYVLPAPPSASERRSVSLIPGEEERKREQEYLKARASILKLYQLLSAKRFDESLNYMSQETRDFLAFVSPRDKNPSVTLVESRLVLKDGTNIQIEPVSFLLAPDLSKLKDTVDGVQEQESARRKEVYAVQKDGKARRIVMILEGGKWVLHRTSIQQASK